MLTTSNYSLVSADRYAHHVRSREGLEEHRGGSRPPRAAKLSCKEAVGIRQLGKDEG